MLIKLFNIRNIANLSSIFYGWHAVNQKQIVLMIRYFLLSINIFKIMSYYNFP